MLVVLKASQAEDGCIVYSYRRGRAGAGPDPHLRGLARPAALGAHGKAPHLAAWREAGQQLGVSDRRLTLYDVAGQTPL